MLILVASHYLNSQMCYLHNGNYDVIHYLLYVCVCVFARRQTDYNNLYNDFSGRHIIQKNDECLFELTVLLFSSVSRQLNNHLYKRNDYMTFFSSKSTKTFLYNKCAHAMRYKYILYKIPCQMAIVLLMPNNSHLSLLHGTHIFFIFILSSV